MHDFTIRPWKPDDKPRLKELWRVSFGDGDAYIDSFMDSFLREDACLVAEADGQPVSAMYIVPGETLFPYRRERISAGYAYALATLPAYRGRGIGRAVYKAVNDKILETADAACVLPAEESLYPFYGNASGAAVLSALREGRITKAELAGQPSAMIARVPAYQYAGMREWFLSELPHVTFPEEMYDHLEACGTEFFMMENGVAAAETENGVCRILELLAPRTDGLAAVANVARWCPAEEYIVRTPLFFDGPGQRRPFLLAAMKQQPDFPMPDDLWWGFGLD